MTWLLRHVFDHPTPGGAAIIAGKTLLVYVCVVAGLRLLGKRELGQMNLYDLVLIIILGNAVQNAMINGDNTLGGGIVAGVVLLIANRILNVGLSRSRRLEGLLVGTPVLIVHDGVVIQRAMRHEGITRDELMAALREHGIEALKDVHLCVLEVDGTMSVVPRQAAVLKTRRHYRGLRLP